VVVGLTELIHGILTMLFHFRRSGMANMIDGCAKLTWKLFTDKY
jgi:hypothetical protein